MPTSFIQTLHDTIHQDQSVANLVQLTSGPPLTDRRFNMNKSYLRLVVDEVRFVAYVWITRGYKDVTRKIHKPMLYKNF